jgi:hypothetical protein
MWHRSAEEGQTIMQGVDMFREHDGVRQYCIIFVINVVSCLSGG